MSKNANRLFSPLRRLLGGAKRGQDLSRSLLLMRLENTEALGNILDKAAMGHLMVQLSMTLGGAVRPYDPVQVLAPGLFAFVLRDRTDRDALQVARRLHQQGQTPVALSGQQVTPVMTGVLIHATTPDLPSITALVDNARQRMNLVEDCALASCASIPTTLPCPGRA